jgi:predicted nucleic-acid-binding Zn-ribbon protein
MPPATSCPNCGSESLYETEGVPAAGAYSPDLLPGLGNAIHRAKFSIVVCEECGLTRLFAGEEPRSKLASSSKWSKLGEGQAE